MSTSSLTQKTGLAWIVPALGLLVSVVGGLQVKHLIEQDAARQFGFDMYAEPVRRAAMDQARDTGEAALSGKVELVQETGTQVQAGALMYVPVYRNEAPVQTLEQRQAALIGWAYSPYRMHDLMSGILGDWAGHQGKTVDLTIYDGREASPDRLLFDSKPAVTPDPGSLFHQPRTLDFNGRPWLLVCDRLPTASGIDYRLAWTALASGAALSGLLFWLMLAVINTRVNALRIADRLTEEIRRHEDKLYLAASVFTHAWEGIMITAADGTILDVNDAFGRITSYSRSTRVLCVACSTIRMTWLFRTVCSPWPPPLTARSSPKGWRPWNMAGRPGFGPPWCPADLPGDRTGTCSVAPAGGRVG